MAKSARSPRKGKTIDLSLSFTPFHQPVLVSPTADETKVGHYRSTDRDDTILVASNLLYRIASIDGGKGLNKIEGSFGSDIFTPRTATPLVNNIQRAYLRAEDSNNLLDFNRWSGLTLAEVVGKGGPPDAKTEFINLPNNAALGVTSFNGQAIFLFAPPPPNSLSFHPLDLYLNDNGGGEVQVDHSTVLRVHAFGKSGRQRLTAPAATSITIDGPGDVDLEHYGGPLLTIDASKATGHITFTEHASFPVDVKTGRNSFNIISTRGMPGDSIDFQSQHIGNNVYAPQTFFNLMNTSSAALSTTSGLDAHAIQIKNFNPLLDKIDLRQLAGLPAYELAVSQEVFSGTAKVAAETAAKKYVHPNTHAIIAFKHAGSGSTYIFHDVNGDQKVDASDGVIKLVGVSSHGSADFITPGNFITL